MTYRAQQIIRQVKLYIRQKLLLCQRPASKITRADDKYRRRHTQQEDANSPNHTAEKHSEQRKGQADYKCDQHSPKDALILTAAQKINRTHADQ